MSISQLMRLGIVIIDKPPGPSSHEVTTWVKKILKVNKAGHTGTLDPQVTGVLPVGLNRSTRLLPYITKKDKTYVGILKFNSPVDEKVITQVFRLFTGKTLQYPPKKSAVKRRHRTRTIYSLEVLEVNDNRVLFKAHVEAGTYIRGITRDISYLLDFCILEELRRTAVGNITEQYAVKLQDLVDAYWLWENKGDSSLLEKMIHPIHEFIDLPRVIVRSSAVKPLAHGSPLFIPGVIRYDKFDKGQNIIIFSEDGLLIGVHTTVTSSESLKNVNKGILSKPETIVITPEETGRDREINELE